DRSHVPYLTQALDDTNPMVRGYSAWALGRLGSDEARAAIVKALKVETDESARGEMEVALAA
ncbi:HEAT repeat domain-containing protein, partial [Candidatus Bipolaricaulota bacterium]|nr:HEAT repeat domain-containing protein [Candidatus Bipolaricaulota bacterium]